MVDEAAKGPKRVYFCSVLAVICEVMEKKNSCLEAKIHRHMKLEIMK